MENILEVRNLSKAYKDFSLKNINLTLKRGYIMGFIGPNGSGKSTTIKLIMNLIKKDAGEIKIFGLDHLEHELEIKERIGFVYDENNFYEELTGKEIKNFIRPFYRRWNEAIFGQYAEKFQLPLNKQIKNYSKGMKMKLALTIALSHEAELLIMDEPTSGLDPLVRNEMLEILQSLILDENKSVFFSTHITSDLEKVADYITLIYNGEIKLSKTKDELLEEYCLVKGNKEMVQKEGFKELFVSVKSHEFGFEALSARKREVKELLGDSVVIEKPTLEDIMIYTTRGEYNVPSY